MYSQSGKKYRFPFIAILCVGSMFLFLLLCHFDSDHIRRIVHYYLSYGEQKLLEEQKKAISTDDYLRTLRMWATDIMNECDSNRVLHQLDGSYFPHNEQPDMLSVLYPKFPDGSLVVVTGNNLPSLLSNIFDLDLKIDVVIRLDNHNNAKCVAASQGRRGIIVGKTDYIDDSRNRCQLMITNGIYLYRRGG